MERIIHKASGYQEARRWDIEQQRSMTPAARPRVSPIRTDASHFSPDTRAFFAALAAERVRYAVVGGNVPGIDSPSALAPEGVVVQFGQPPNRSAQRHRRRVVRGRPKDLDDLSYLGPKD